MEKWYDLSQPFFTGMPYAKVLKPPKIEKILEVGTNQIAVTEYMFNTHIGTHVDAPCHILEDGVDLTFFSLEKFIGEGMVLDIPKQEREPITVPDLEMWKDSIQPGDMVFVRTGWGAKFKQEEYHEHPYFTVEAAQWLVKKGISIIGIDFVTVDQPHSLRDDTFHFPIHRIFLENHVLIMEHMFLEELGGQRIFIVAPPLKIDQADGSPCRVVAKIL